MFNVNFKSIAEAAKLNNRTEAEMVNDLITFYKNQNYRSNYNKEKNEILKKAKNDPRMKALMAELRKKA